MQAGATVSALPSIADITITNNSLSVVIARERGRSSSLWPPQINPPPVFTGCSAFAGHDESRVNPSLKGRLRGPFSFCETAVRRRPRLTRARLHELLHYDSETGEFRWAKRVSKQIRVGAVAGTLEVNGYRKIPIERGQYSAHQLAWFYMTGRWRSGLIDHRDGDRANNRWDNLRRATQSQNCANKRRARNNRSGFKGVTKTPSGRWSAAIQKNGRNRYLGIFTTPQEAHAAYMAEARKLFGEFARAE